MSINIDEGFPGELMLKFTYNSNYISKVKTIKGRKWDPKNQCWVIPNNQESINSVKKLFEESSIVDRTGILNSVVYLHKPWKQDILRRLNNELILKGYSQKTRKSYIGHIRRLIDFHKENPVKLQNYDIRQYLLYLIEKQEYSHSYVNQVISAIKFLYNFVFHRSDITINISRPKKEKKLPIILSQEEVVNLLNALDNIKHKTILYLIYSAGLRLGEVIRLKTTDIDRNRMLIHIVQGKGRKDRYTILSKKALEVLELYEQCYTPSDWLFPGANPSKFVTERTVQKIFENARNKAGIKKNVTVHSLRHSFATHLLEGGVNLRYIQELLGHQNTKTTEIYTHVTKNSIRNITSPLDSI